MLERRSVNFGLITFASSFDGFQFFSHRFNGREFTEQPKKVIERLRNIEFTALGGDTTPSLEALRMTQFVNWPISPNPRIIMLVANSPPDAYADGIEPTHSCLKSFNCNGLLILTDIEDSISRDQYLALLDPHRRHDLMYDINASKMRVFRHISSIGLETVYYDPFEEEHP